jgi:hypothetical protein
MPETSKQTPGHNGYVHMEKISPMTSSSAERPGPKQRRKHCSSGVVLNRASYEEFFNRPNTTSFLGAKQKKKLRAKKS